MVVTMRLTRWLDDAERAQAASAHPSGGPRRIRRWLRPGGLLARFLSAPSDDRAAPLQGVFRLSSAEVWRLAQQRRSQYLAVPLNRKSTEAAIDGPDRLSGRTQPRPTDPGATAATKFDEPSVNGITENRCRRCHSSTPS